MHYPRTLTIYPLIVETHENKLIEEGQLNLMTIWDDMVYFQQIGAAPNYALPVQQWLDEHFPGAWVR